MRGKKRTGKIKALIKYFLLERNDMVYEAFQHYCRTTEKRNVITNIVQAIKLNLYYSSGKSKKLQYPEYAHVDLKTVLQLYDEIKEYDIISFDVFDTLLFRTVEKPEDVFTLLGMENNIPNFKELRIHAEQNAREETNNPNGEIRIEDIYKKIEEWCEIRQREGIQKELEMEHRVCFANPYMKELLKKLQLRGKMLIAISDMYLSEEQVRKLLEDNGLMGLNKIFVSGNQGVNKRTGELQKKVREQYGIEKRIVHIGDNWESDIIASKNAGIEAIYYPNVNQEGRPYRGFGKHDIVTSVYSGIVNAFLYAGNNKISPSFEYGFVYGGILTTGFCQWLNKLGKIEGIEKFLFTARDGNIIHKVYKKFYGTIESDYLLYSRCAVLPLLFSENIEEYFKEALIPRLEKEQMTLNEILIDLGLEGVLEEVSISDWEEEKRFGKQDLEAVRKFFYTNRAKVERQYQKRCQAAKEYITKMAGNSRKVCVVDLGWRGSSILQIKRLLEKNGNYEVIGALVGAADSDYTNPYVANGVIHAYSFSHYKNQEFTRIQRNLEQIFYVEAMFSAESPSMIGYTKDEEGNLYFEYENIENGNSYNNQEMVREIQRGILEFSREYNEKMKKMKINLNIISRTAYEPLYQLLKNEKYLAWLFEKYYEDEKMVHGFHRKNS